MQTFASNSANNTNTMEPIVEAQISQSAVDKAASPDGVKCAFGFLISPQEYEASIANGKGTTAQKLNVFAITAGAEYAKSFKNRLFLAVQLLLDFAKKKKQEGNWHALNEDFDFYSYMLPIIGEKRAKFQTDMVTPSLGLKAGYLFRKQRCVAYFKLGISRLSGEYTYKLNNENFANVKANTIAPNLSIGCEYRINNKIGVSAEIGFPIKKNIHKKSFYGVEHRTKISRMEIRILGTYTISKTDSMPSSLSNLTKF